MPPTGSIEEQRRIRLQYFEELKKLENNPPPINLNQPLDLTGFGFKRSAFNFYGTQQRERLERLIPAGTAGMSNSIFAYRGQAFREASIVYHNVIADGAKNFGAGSNTIEITGRALIEYRKVLNSYGVSPSEAPSHSILNATDFLDAESVRKGGLFTLDKNVLHSFAQTGEQPKYLARMIYTGDKPISDAGVRLAKYDAATGQGKTIAWSTRVEDLAGSRMDYREVMSRIGWTASDIAGANPKDFKVVVFTEEAAVNLQFPSDKTIVGLARADGRNFKNYQTESDAFWKGAVGYDKYEARLAEAKTLGFDMRNKPNDFISTLPVGEQETMRARFQLENAMGVNPLFTGDLTTRRPDNINGRTGVREYITDNTPSAATLLEMSKNGQVAFFDLHDFNTAGTPVDVVAKPTNLPILTERQMMASETKQGALMGGALSAATSLPEVFEKYESGDYLGAAQTFAGNTALGTGVGAFSSTGEHIVGNQIASRLTQSTFAQEGIERLYTSGAARNVVSRFAGTEASNITSQTFNSTVRTMAGRIGGAGVVGGIVNGGFAAYDQIGAYKRGEVTASQAIGTVTGEAAVGVGAGLAGAAAGAAIGSIIPGAGTLVGGIIGFGVGMAAGYLADKGLRGLGVNTLIAKGVTATIDAGAKAVGAVETFGKEAANTISNAAESVGNTVNNAVNDVGNAVSGGLKSMFGW